ncbi:CLUMA_CG002183, isoform A [Clunio marinus]|uniref:CLUMA_CG002183, isoform A n=1 Tax=Clunio marinus TaxID=568069 RepID=A0A1J1HK26_9DIPT|nr:CLUMA_CG002183, isoform A [Clunio marinus]
MFSSNLLRDCCCLRRSSKNNFALNPPESLISLDSGHIGQEVVILKNGKRVCGSGGAVLNQALLQSKSYFEVKIQQSGHWSLGLCTLNTDLNKTRGGLDKFSWCLNAENYVMNDGHVLYDLNEMYSSNGNKTSNDDTEQLLPLNNKEDITNLLPSSSNASQRSALPQEGDIIGITYDHIELNFYLNGKNLNIPTLIKLNSTSTRGEYNNEIYPLLVVDDGAILDLIVDNFNYQIPSGYDKIMVEQTLL